MLKIPFQPVTECHRYMALGHGKYEHNIINFNDPIHLPNACVIYIYVLQNSVC